MPTVIRTLKSLVTRGVLQGFGADLKLATRRLGATPLFTIFAVLSLGLGVGVTTAVYSVVDRIFWKELGIADPGQVVLVLGTEAGPYDARFVVSQRDFAGRPAPLTQCVLRARTGQPGLRVASWRSPCRATRREHRILRPARRSAGRQCRNARRRRQPARPRC
jgi:hypothetical protein